ncbi:cytochrome o ubiquinol oxidase subunit II [Candidatus Blochmanniella floridana]|uniref:Ubiquinol oxidase subunit 2 n=1 Tax=Blochmanniella floridana TaxID=203907 RepID=Q7VRH2_BLOFL|nr:cytochrome o ubiquinol oxidase subunit II [Candidatus Blochmannia floridanus]
MKYILYRCKKISITIAFYSTIIFLTGCNNLVLMNPKGSIGLEERSLILTVLSLMLIIIIPVLILTIIFSIQYRASNTNNTKYDPNWIECRIIEFTIWFVPIVIIIILSVLTWKSTQSLDPKNTIITYENNEPITIHVIALDWKWLFIYPQYNIAVINELVFPTNVPVHFNITSNAVMNSFFIPQLGSQIYAMAGMCTQLNLIANTSGKYKGISSNFSGRGFSGMKFAVTATKNYEEFDKWIKTAQLSKNHILNINTYEKLAKPSEFHPITYFANIKPNLFYEVINKFIHQKYNI